jgi:alpha-glucosidase (family GH31 glycosyl hydrolase)
MACRPRSGGKAHVLGSDVDQEAFRVQFNAKRVVTGFHQDGQRVDITTATLPIRIEFLSETLFKIRYGNRSAFSSEYSFSIAEDFKPKTVSVTAVDQNNQIRMSTNSIQVLIGKDAGTMTVLNSTGQEVLALKNLFADAFADGTRQVSGKPPQKRLLLGAQFTMHDGEHFYGLGEKLRGPFDQSLDWRGRKRDDESPGDSFGNRFDGADGGANGNVMIPFLVTNRGAGLFFDTVYHTYWEFNDPAQHDWYAKMDCDQNWESGSPKCERSEMRFYVMIGAQPSDAIEQYTSLTGRPIMPPRWLLGYQQSRYGYNNWSELESATQSLRADGFPLDGIFLDLQWFGGVPGALATNDNDLGNFGDCGHRQIGSFDWSTSGAFDFSNPQSHLASLKKQGIHVVPIEEGYFDTCLSGNVKNPNFSEAQSKGYLARKDFGSNDAAVFANGNDDTDDHFGSIGYFGQVGMVDTTNADARKWFWSKHLPILKDGASLFWTDLGEPERFRWWWKYSDGKWHQDIHNVWDLNRARSFYDGYSADLPDLRPFLMSRSGYAGSQRYGVALWSADAPAKLGWAAAQPSAHLNLAMSGVPYTTSDVGGFGGFPFSNAAQYTRWLQMESFSSLVRSHGNTTGSNVGRVIHPNQFGEPYTAINRKYLQWRESLVPYIYTHAREAFDKGLPIVRALPLAWPADSETADLGSEYLLGPSILVAPVLLGDNNNPKDQRDIYLPRGRWFDLHDGSVLEGGKWYRQFAAPIEKMPLFALEGAILPRAVVTSSLSEPSWNETRLFEIYPAASPSTYTLYDDDGESNEYKQSNNGFAKTEINVTPQGRLLKIAVGAMLGAYRGKPAKRSYGFEVRLDQMPTQVSWNGVVVPLRSSAVSAFPLGMNDAQWNGPMHKLFVQFSADDVANARLLEIAR